MNQDLYARHGSFHVLNPTFIRKIVLKERGMHVNITRSQILERGSQVLEASRRKPSPEVINIVSYFFPLKQAGKENSTC